MNDQTKPLILVTGSSGLIGQRCIEDLAADHRVVGLDLMEPERMPADSDWIKCDLTDAESVVRTLERVRAEFGEQIASVIHLAAYYDFSGEPSPLYEDLTVRGTQRLLRALSSFEVRQFVFSSTLLLMRSSEDGEPLDADAPTEAEWDYPQSKLRTETLIERERRDVPAVILRLAGVYDEGCHSLPIAQQIRRIHEKQLESYLFPGDKTHGQAFVHLEDVVSCFRRVVERRDELEPREILLIGEEDVMSYEELQEEIGKLIHGKEWPTIRIPKVAAKAGAWAKEKMAGDKEDEPFIKPWMVDLADQNYPIRITRAREHLGWEPRHTLRKTLPAMIERLKENPKAWYEENGLPLPEGLEQRQDAGAAKG